MSFLRHVQELRSSQLRLAGELSTAESRLQEAIHAAASHTCSPPRPYGDLLVDLRAQTIQDGGVDSVNDMTHATASCSSGIDSAGTSSASPTLLSSPPVSSIPQSSFPPTLPIRPTALSLKAGDDPGSSAGTSVLSSVLMTSSPPSSATHSNSTSMITLEPGHSQLPLDDNALTGTGPGIQCQHSPTGVSPPSTNASSAPSGCPRSPPAPNASKVSRCSQSTPFSQDSPVCDTPPGDLFCSRGLAPIPPPLSTVRFETTSLRSPSLSSRRRQRRRARSSRTRSRARQAVGEIQLVSAFLAVDRVRTAWLHARTEVLGASMSSVPSSKAAPAATSPLPRGSSPTSSITSKPAEVAPSGVFPMCVSHYSAPVSITAASDVTALVQQHLSPNGSSLHLHSIPSCASPPHAHPISCQLRYPNIRLIQLLSDPCASPLLFSIPASVPLHQQYTPPHSFSSYSPAPPHILRC
ncbi:hypothetical protein CF326_g7799 [Tilletia indica]|uniref:Uncharacterized protein n=1 Tax=Tilletia indica TaxID=43049 RepID=A0A177SZG5_9BASI|nr:hypothetical protein CF326_g7799 [Tilletia indica]KAE8237335.1 hypothetical protein A4X13_0g8827 [Tilletia indica]